MTQPMHKIVPNTGTLEQIAHKYLQKLPGSLPMPKFEIPSNYNSPWLGRCTWKPGEPNTTIQVQRNIFKDEETLHRVIAHELCHHYDFLVNELPDYQKSPKAYSFLARHREGHGPKFHKIAAMLNSVFGKDFITEKSDEAMVVDAVRDYLCLLAKDKAGRIYWAVAARPSAKQKAYLAKAMSAQYDHREYKLVRLTDPLLAQGSSIGTGMSSARTDGTPVSHSLIERLQLAWDHGHSVPVPHLDTVLTEANASSVLDNSIFYATFYHKGALLRVACGSAQASSEAVAFGGPSVFEEIYLPLALRKPEATGVVVNALRQARLPADLKVEIPSQLPGCVEVYLVVPGHDLTFTVQAEQTGKVKLDLMDGSNRKNVLTREFGPSLWSGTLPIAMATIMMHIKRGLVDVLHDLDIPVH